MLSPSIQSKFPSGFQKSRIEEFTALTTEANLPHVLAKIVQQYLHQDFSPLGSLSMDSTERDVQLPDALRNRLKEALGSSDCDPEIKTKIFALAKSHPGFAKALKALIQEIMREGGTANFDDVTVDGFDFSRLNLFGMSAERATFIDVRFSDADLSRANWTNATLIRAKMYGGKLTGATLLGITCNNVTFWQVHVEGMTTDDQDFKRISERNQLVRINRPAGREARSYLCIRCFKTKSSTPRKTYNFTGQPKPVTPLAE
jgi:Pentapeptide repeats (8 copies)